MQELFSTTVGSKKRPFNSEWYKEYKWLEHLIEKDAFVALVDFLVQQVDLTGTMQPVSQEYC